MGTPIPSFSFPSSPFTVKRKTTSGTWVDGRWQPSNNQTTFTITASVQRLSMKETQLLPESFRATASYRVYTETELLIANEVLTREADIITIDGEDYKIIDVEHWRQLMPHYKAIAVRIERNAQ